MEIEKRTTFEKSPDTEELKNALEELQKEILEEVDEDYLSDKRFLVTYEQETKALALRVVEDD